MAVETFLYKLVIHRQHLCTVIRLFPLITDIYLVGTYTHRTCKQKCFAYYLLGYYDYFREHLKDSSVTTDNVFIKRTDSF